MSYDPNQPQQPPYGQSGQAPNQPRPDVPPKQYTPQQSPYGAPSQAFYGQPGYNGVSPASNYVAPPPQKRSLRWLWITLSIVGVLLLGSCVTCGILTSRGIGFLAQAAGPTVAVDQYYLAIQKQDYATAYSYLTNDATLTSQGVTVPVVSQQEYTQTAQLLDKHFGTVTKHLVTTTGSNTTLLTITITRGKDTTYASRFTMVQVGSNWKIKNMNGSF